MLQHVATSNKNTVELLGGTEPSAENVDLSGGRDEFESQLSAANASSRQPREKDAVNDTESYSKKTNANTTGESQTNQEKARSEPSTSLSSNDDDSSVKKVSENTQKTQSDEAGLVSTDQDVTEDDTNELLALFAKIKIPSETSETSNDPKFVDDLTEKTGLFEIIESEDAPSTEVTEDNELTEEDLLANGLNLGEVLPEDIVPQTNPSISPELSPDETTSPSDDGVVSDLNIRRAPHNLFEQFGSVDTLADQSKVPTTQNIKTEVLNTPLGELEIEQQLRQVLNLKGNELDNAVTQISQFVSQNTAASQVVSKEVAGALKSVISELSNQLEKGTDIGINLNDIVESVSQRLSSSAPQINPEQLNVALQQLPNAINAVTQSLAGFENVNGSVPLDSRLISENHQSQTEITKLTPQTNDKGVALGKSEAAQQIADKIQVVVNQKNLVAEIKLDPQELGSLQVRVQIQGDQANVNFTVQNQTTRDLLEQAVPRLRELLQDKGIELGQSNVQQEQRNGNNDSDGQQAHQGQGGEEALAGTEEVVETKVVNGHLGAIDYFA